MSTRATRPARTMRGARTTNVPTGLARSVLPTSATMKPESGEQPAVEQARTANRHDPVCGRLIRVEVDVVLATPPWPSSVQLWIVVPVQLVPTRP